MFTKLSHSIPSVPGIRVRASAPARGKFTCRRERRFIVFSSQNSYSTRPLFSVINFISLFVRLSAEAFFGGSSRL
jgi:hypothetical protein